MRIWIHPNIFVLTGRGGAGVSSVDGSQPCAHNSIMTPPSKNTTPVQNELDMELDDHVVRPSVPAQRTT